MPTGNFGDIFAGYAAKRMGLPIDKLVIATNENDILARCLATGAYRLGDVTPTASPSMDIQVSSNFERLLFEAHRRDAEAVVTLMDSLATSGEFVIEGAALKAIRADFVAGRADQGEGAETIRETYRRTGFLADPHTAVGLAVADRFRDPAIPMVTLATAHPAKFPEAVEAASGISPSLPAGFADQLGRAEHFKTIANDRAAVEAFITTRTRAVAEKV